MGDLVLRCAVYDEGIVFTVKIARDASMSELWKAIAHEQHCHWGDGSSPDALTLFLAKKNGQ